MRTVTGILTGIDDAPQPNITITFTLINARTNPTSSFDAITHELIHGTDSVITGIDGSFSISLYENTKLVDVTSYLVTSSNGSLDPFISALSEGVGALNWLEFKMGGAPITAAELLVIDAFVNKAEVAANMAEAKEAIISPHYAAIENVSANMPDLLLLETGIHSKEYIKYKNLFPNGDFFAGQPSFRKNSPVIELPLSSPLKDRGYEKGINWALSNDHARHEYDGVLNNKYVFGCFLIHSDNVANITPRIKAALISETASMAIANLYPDVGGYIDVGTNTRLVWATGQVIHTDALNILVGQTLIPLDNTLYATGFYVTVQDTPVDADKALDYYLFRENMMIDALRRDKSIALPSVKNVLTVGGSGTSYITCENSNGDIIKRGFTPFSEPSLTTSNVFNFSYDIVNDVAIKITGDDATPYHVWETTIGANHGYTFGLATATAHGKTQADIGAVYINGTTEYIIVSIESIDTLHIAIRTSGVLVSGTYTHVSGGTSVSSIVVSAIVSTKWNSAIQNKKIELYVDGELLTERTGAFSYTNNVQLVESYEVLQYSEVIAWWEANGASGSIQPSGRTPSFTVSTTYEFDTDSNCTEYTDFLALGSIDLQDIMFLQTSKMESIDGVVKYYVPKALPFTHDTIPYNWANIDSIDTSTWTTRADFTPSRCEPTGILCDRVIQLSDNYAYAIGFLSVADTSIANRRTQATDKALQLSTSGKVYMTAIDKGTVNLVAGDYFSTIGYRNIFKRPNERTSDYVVRTQGDDYLYMDWHNVAKFDRVDIPQDLAGRVFEVVEKSANVTLHSRTLTGSIAVNVSAIGTYGYLIIKVNK